MTLFHRHKWEAVAIEKFQRIVQDTYQWTGVRDEGTATRILYKCAKCPKSETETLMGEWTLDQIKSKQGDNKQ